MTTLVLQICLYFSGIYLAFFSSIELSIQIYKWVTLPYSAGTLSSELVLFLLLIIVEVLRIKLGKRGNLTNQIIPLVASLLLIAPSLLAVLYRWDNFPVLWKIVLTFHFFKLTLAKLRTSSGSNSVWNSNWDTIINTHHFHHQTYVCIVTTFHIKKLTTF